jgi:uncharacterized protein YfaQ (DUF2300 family)
LRLYVPGCRNRKLYTPTSLAFAEETSVVLALRNSSDANGTVIPAGSVTVTVSLARKSCAPAAEANKAMRATLLRETAQKRWSERHMAQTSWFTPTAKMDFQILNPDTDIVYSCRKYVKPFHSLLTVTDVYSCSLTSGFRNGYECG